MTEKRIEQMIEDLSRKLDHIIGILEGSGRQNRPTQKKVKSVEAKEKPGPLTEAEIAKHMAKFEEMFLLWETGKEFEVDKELESMEIDRIRRFADSNNLNVTAKMGKQKIMQLIGGRFRERRQLLRPHFRRGHDES